MTAYNSAGVTVKRRFPHPHLFSSHIETTNSDKDTSLSYSHSRTHSLTIGPHRSSRIPTPDSLSPGFGQ